MKGLERSMGGRHRTTSRGSARRWIAASAGLAVAAAAVLAVGPASASTSVVTATFGVTGVSTSNCPVSTGGSTVYVKPGQELDIKTSVVGMTVLGVPLSTAQIAGLEGTMVIDPGKSDQKTLPLSATKITKLTYLDEGTHTYTWTATKVSVLGLTLPLSLNLNFAKAGASLSYAGTIHVTTAAAQCGVSVQVPGVGASASVSGLPPIKISLPPVNVTVPVDPGKLLSKVPSAGGGSSGGGSGSSSSGSYTPPPPSIPEEVVPKGLGGFLGTGGGYFGGALPDLATPAAAPANLAPAAGAVAPKTHVAKTNKAAKKPVEYATNERPSAQMPVLLAIIAIIALSLVTATYARLYMLRKP